MAPCEAETRGAGPASASATGGCCDAIDSDVNDLQRQLAEEQAAEALPADDEEAGPKDWQRFYMGYHQRFVEDCVLELQGGRLRVSLAQAPSAKVAAKKAAEGRGGKGSHQQQRGAKQLDKASDPALTGTTVWDGAVVLSHYLTETSVLVRQGDQPYAYSAGRLPSVLELGAGTGAVSLALAATRLAASVTITDLPDLLPHLEVNVGRNAALLQGPPDRGSRGAVGDGGPARVHLQALRWGPEGEQDVQSLAPVQPPYDVIVGSDLIYYSYTPETPHSRLLLWTLRRLCGPHSTVFLSLSLHHNPEEVEQFLSWAEAGDDGFHVLRLRRSIPAEWRVPDVLVVRLTPKWTAAEPVEPPGESAAPEADAAANSGDGTGEDGGIGGEGGAAVEAVEQVPAAAAAVAEG